MADQGPDGPATVVARIEAAAARSTTPFDGGRMVWQRWGAGAPVVLLHGASGSWTHWIRNVAALAEQFTVLAPDLPGFGESDALPEPHTAERLADTVVAGIEAHRPSPAPLDLVGFSFGGIVAGLAAARLGTRVRRLVLLGPGGMAFRSDAGRLVLARVEPGMSEAAGVDNLRRARFRAMPAIRARITAIFGGRDAFAVPYLEERRDTLARFQPGLDFRVVTGAGHWVGYEAPAAVNRALRQMLA